MTVGVSDDEDDDASDHFEGSPLSRRKSDESEGRSDASSASSPGRPHATAHPVFNVVEEPSVGGTKRANRTKMQGLLRHTRGLLQPRWHLLCASLLCGCEIEQKC